VDSPGAVSYKEIVSAEPTVPKWYTCHWWGESVLDFINCCEQHTKLHQLQERDSRYWICGYANRQHSLHEEINTSCLKETSFYKAMQLAEGVLLILDSEATPFTRMWCCFEIYKTVTTDRLRLNIATVPKDGSEEAIVLSQETLKGESDRTKNVRHSKFPHQLLMAGLTRRLEDGDCSVRADCERIRGYIARDAPQDVDQDAREAVALLRANQSLRSYFALVAWPFAIQYDLVRDFDGDGDIMEGDDLIHCLRDDETRTTLRFSLAHFEEVENADVRDLLDGLPPHLLDLNISFEACIGITNVGIKNFKDKLPRSLLSLHLSFMGCNQVSDEGIFALAAEIAELQYLSDLDLDCSMCPDITFASVAAIVGSMRPGLEKCCLRFRGTGVGRDFKTGIGKDCFKNVKELQAAVLGSSGLLPDSLSKSLPSKGSAAAVVAVAAAAAGTT